MSNQSDNRFYREKSTGAADDAASLSQRLESLSVCIAPLGSHSGATRWESAQAMREAATALRQAASQGSAGGERASIIEECAKIAESHKWSEETKAATNGARTYGNDGACENIAAAIRAVSPPLPKTGGGEQSEVQSGALAEELAAYFHRAIFSRETQILVDRAIEALRPVAQASPAYPAEEYAKVAMGNAIEIGRLHIMVQRMERAVKAANVYFGCYVQDEAEEIECCISPEQHEAAKELRDALRIAVAALLDRRKPLPADLPPASDLADAIAAADWSGVSIGNKEFLKAAIIHLRHGASSVPSADCGGGK